MIAAQPLSVAEAAPQLGYGKDALYDAIRRGDCPIPVIRVGRTLKLPAGLVSFYATWSRLPESPAELAEHMRAMHGEEIAS